MNHKTNSQNKKAHNLRCAARAAPALAVVDESLRLASLPFPQLRDLIRELPPYPLGLSPPMLVVTQLVGPGLALELAVVLEAIGIQCP